MRRTAKVALEVRRQQEQANENAMRCEALYAGHRAALTGAILSLAEETAGGRLCLLGAGNCLDVDLPALGERFERIDLVDLDAAALDRAIARQPAATRARLAAHAGLDLGGMLDALDRFRADAPTLAAMDALVAPAVERNRGALAGPYAVVASCCLATQLSRSLTVALGEGHPALADLRRRMALVHLRTLAALAPGGRALFATDVTSSETYPLDALPPDADLAPVLAEVVAAGNVFFGGDPALHQSLLRRDPVLKAAIASTRPLPPWLWRINEERTLLVHALALSVRA